MGPALALGLDWLVVLPQAASPTSAITETANRAGRFIFPPSETRKRSPKGSIVQGSIGWVQQVALQVAQVALVVFQVDLEVPLDGQLAEGLMLAREALLLRREPDRHVANRLAGVGEAAQRVIQVGRAEVAAVVPVGLEARVLAGSDLLDAHQEAFALGGFQVGRDLAKRPFVGCRPPVLPVGDRQQDLSQPPLAGLQVGDGLSHARTVM